MRKAIRQFTLALFLILMSFASFSVSAQMVGEPLRKLPVQDAGRLKPFETFAKETLQLVYGKSKFKGKSPVDVVMTWILIPDQWDQMEVIEVRHSGLREALKLPEDQIHFRPSELLTNERVPLLFQELRSHRETENKLNPYFQALQRLENQITMYHAVRNGMAIRVAPNPETDTWYSIAELPSELAPEFEAIASGFVKSLTALEGDSQQFQATQKNLADAVQTFMAKAKALAPEKYADMNKIRAEVHYNDFHPFQWAWISYLLGAILMISHLVAKRRWQLLSGFVFIGLGFLLHTYGMGVRSYLTGRPPVSNMYETVVWVPWGCIVFAAILEKLQKTRVILIAASLISVFCLILTDLAPSVLDASLHPLEPVLRSTFWLTTHVLIITISYAAFFLAFGLGDLVLFYYLRDEKRYAAQINKAVTAIYRSVQIGVVLLAAGTILGGIWADYSWGRFWGWDPKETWALIALLGYLALLHGRLVGWVKGFGMAAGSIVAFSLVIMAWYGVNYVLGAGLHSYGFGAGGVEYVSMFVAAHLLYVVYVATLRYSRHRASAS